MDEIKLPPKEFDRGLQQFIALWQRKLRKGLLPPDPARIADYILSQPASIEHATPLPPVIEYIHANLTEKVVENLPRLPMTGDFPKHEWLRWIKEQW